jgi:hypothetical protein
MLEEAWAGSTLGCDEMAAETGSSDNEINNEECCKALRELKVDLFVLAGTPIVRANVLSVTLQAH